MPDVTFLSFHPGWVAPEMGNEAGQAPTTIASSVQAIRYHRKEGSSQHGRVRGHHDEQAAAVLTILSTATLITRDSGAEELREGERGRWANQMWVTLPQDRVWIRLLQCRR